MQSNNLKNSQKKRANSLSKDQTRSMPASRTSLRSYWSSLTLPGAYVGLSLLALLCTTLFWTLKTAGLQLSNADQLVDPYLFSSSKVLHGAQFPGSHSFLIKWPVFYLIKLFSFSSFAYGLFTLLFVLITVGGLAWVIYKIESRPIYFANLILALSSVLLLVPAEPSAGTLLPVNMAMLTTRNIEYLVYIVSLILIVKASRLFGIRTIIAVLLQALLFASDKMFLYVSLGGAFICLLVFALDSSWKMTRLGARWLCTSLAGAIASIVAVGIINTSKLTHIVGASGKGPYGLVSGLHNLIIGIIYGFDGLFTNLGANPAYNEGVIRKIPGQYFSNLFNVGLLAYVVNLVLFVLAAYSVFVIVRRRFKHKQANSSLSESLTFTLIASSIAAFIFFIGTNHYYFADSRYLGMVLFMAFIAGAFVLRQRRFSSKVLYGTSIVLCLAIVSGILSSGQQFKTDSLALAADNSRDRSALAAFESRPESVLVGNYWRVVPIKFLSGSKPINILPLANCTDPLAALTSTAWQANLNKASFAYLMQTDTGPASNGACSLSTTIKAYGHPNSSAVIAGSIEKPKGLLIYYNHGIYKPKKSERPIPSSLAPISLSDLNQAFCRNNVMNIVAHQDDDLLFMNPDLVTGIQDGDCVHTVYITAGDGGQSSYYWLNRQLGSEAAYDYMTGSKNSDWVDHIVKLANNEYIDVDSPRDNNKISLIFMHLPDGGLKGQGFKSNNFESLAKLYSGQIKVIHAVDGQSSYTSSQLVAALTKLMQFYQPDLIRTQANYVSTVFPDHSDHMTVGDFVKRAVTSYDPSDNGLTVKYYIGYPIHAMLPNLNDAQFEEKLNIFLAYSAFDPGACQTVQKCETTPTYNAYLHSEYLNAY
jgi:LmbE family N-acetylglucosaminyl deacetylase